MPPHQLHDHESLAATVPDARSGLNAAREQIDRILSSDTLRASEVLRWLLRFLADKTFSGEADHLKEYSVGLDALGKPATYDPRQDSGVRLQASRLRQKLDEYYRTEGSNDPLTIELPRGRFKIVWHPRRRRQHSGCRCPAVRRWSIPCANCPPCGIAGSEKMAQPCGRPGSGRAGSRMHQRMVDPQGVTHALRPYGNFQVHARAGRSMEPVSFLRAPLDHRVFGSRICAV